MPNTQSNRGLTILLFAFGIWGFFPVYWKTLVSVDEVEILLVRFILTALACLVIMPLRGTLVDFRKAWGQPATLKIFALSGSLLTGNWFSFIWAINTGNVLESSLGYFLCPLVSIVLGRIIFKERLSRIQWTAVLLALIGVAGMIFLAGRVPIAAIVIALSWSGYSVAKKKSQLGPVVGLGLETAILSPLAAIGLLWIAYYGQPTIPSAEPWVLGSLALCGFVTAAPLLLFAFAAPKVKMSTIGMGQYLVPSLHFMLAVFYGESVNLPVLISFSFIWAGLILFSLSETQLISKGKAVDGIPAE
ncbi:MAG: EamA family transporter RarD [Puniceicoccaceae bacterium]